MDSSYSVWRGNAGRNQGVAAAEGVAAGEKDG